MFDYRTPKETGQALVEYALILALVVIALIAILTVTGPTIASIFSNTVVALLDAPEPRAKLDDTDFWNTVTAVWTRTPDPQSFATFTEAPENTVDPNEPTDEPMPTDEPPTETTEPTDGPSLTPTEDTFPVPWADDIEAENSRDFFISDDSDDCSWAVTGEHFRSPASAWSDSPSGAYVHGSNCVLELRGTFDLDTDLETGDRVVLSFWDRWHLSATDRAYVEVSNDDGTTWVNVAALDNGALHYYSSNLVFNYEEVDLSDYVAQGAPLRMRFRLDALSDPSTGDGWYIDDIRIEKADLEAFTYPFYDDVDGGGSCAGKECWMPSGDWAATTEEKHAGSFSYTDSPGSNYAHGGNTSLTLNGYIDIPSDAVDPTLSFWDRWHLRAYDTALVEISTQSDPDSWQALMNHFNSTNLSWARQSIPIPDEYKGKKVRIRFRLDARNHTAVGNGWWIDDIAVDQVTLPEIINLPWWDDMDGNTLMWLPEGGWTVSSEHTRSNQGAWSDSPASSYEHGSNAVLNLNALVNLTSATAPELVFWDRYDLGAYDKAIVEIRREDEDAWTNVYEHNHDTNTSWSRNVVDLTSYVGSRIMIRWRLDARNHTQVADGWWIDDVELREHEDHTITLQNGMWCEDFEPGTSQWCSDNRYQTRDWWITNGSWTLGPEAPPAHTACHSGFDCWSDSPHSNYLHGSNANLMLDAEIDISGTSDPILYFWQASHIRGGDHGYVEVSTDGGNSWSMADPWHSTDDVQGMNVAWTRNQVSLKNFIAAGNIKIRFRLDARDNAQTGDGWWIDDIAIIDRDHPSQQLYTHIVADMPFIDPAEPGYWANWIPEGHWDLTTEELCDRSECEPTSYSYTDSPGTNYIHNTSTSIIYNGYINLNGLDDPRLIIYWKYRTENNRDYVYVQISRDDGYSWRDCISKDNNGGWWEYSCTFWGNEKSADRLMLRIKMEALSGAYTREGLWVDRIQIAE